MTLPLSRDYTAIDGVTQFPAATDQRIQDNIIQAFKVLGIPVTLTSPSTTDDLPQLVVKDAAGHVRAVIVDHNGLPTKGRVNHFREEWKVLLSSITAGGIVSGNPMWFLTVAGAPGGLITQAPRTFYGGTVANIGVLNTLANKMAVASGLQLVNPSNADATWVLEYDLAPDAIGANGFTFWHGLSGSKDPNAPASGYAWFRKANGDTNWQCETNDGATTTTVNSAVAPTVDTAALQRFRIELHGASSPYGAMVRFFINETLVATSTTHLPTAVQYVVFAGLCTAAGTAHELMVGTVSLSSNRFASTGAL